jgi:glycosyltransferase involved in cell wall biosynthesis
LLVTPVDDGQTEGPVVVLRDLKRCLDRHGFATEVLGAPSEEDASRPIAEVVDRSFAGLGPDIVAVASEDQWTCQVLAHVRGRGAATVLLLRDPTRRPAGSRVEFNAILVDRPASADYLRAAWDVEAHVLPCLIDRERVRAEPADARYLTFIDPTPEAGVFAFARIAHELGLRRPDIPILVLEGRGVEADLVACGLDLRANGNVRLMGRTATPRDYWGVTRMAVLPSLGWDGRSRTAIEAMINGVAVIASDRGGLPEILGESGWVLSLPDRLTPATRSLPTDEDVAPWIEAIVRLWDDGELRSEYGRRMRDRAELWRMERVESDYVRLFHSLAPGTLAITDGRSARAGWVVLVPFLSTIEPDCERPLHRLEQAGVHVVRCRGSSAIDLARNTLASEALHRGCEAILFVDADIAFEPDDALHLLARPEPVVAGIYPKKRSRELASAFTDEVDEVVFGPAVPGLYPLEYAAAGFLRIRTDVLRRMIEKLELPLCNGGAGPGGGFWPFFLPMVRPCAGGAHYLGEDWAFCHRLRQIGLTPMADTSFRLQHIGPYGYSWEDTSPSMLRYERYTCRITRPGAG